MSTASADGDEELSNEIHFPAGLSNVLKEQGLAAKAKPMNTNFSMPISTTAAVNAMPSGSATHEDSITVLHNVTEKLNAYNKPHREDGYQEINGEATYFGPDWLDEEQVRQHLITTHPEYQFLMLVAGASHREPTILFKKEALDQHSKRLLQRAATTDEIRKENLKDISSVQRSIDSVIKLQSAADLDLKKGRAILQNLRAMQNAYTEIVEASLENMEEKSILKKDGSLQLERIVRIGEVNVSVAASLDQFVSLSSRCKYPTEGLDSSLFADEVLRWFSTLAVDTDVLALITNMPTAKEVAEDHNPAFIRLAVLMTFSYALTKTPANLHFVVSRMKNSFPAEGEYAKTPHLFEQDLVELFERLVLHSDDDSKAHVTWKYMNINVYLQLACMYERWYGKTAEMPQTEEEDKCGTFRPILQKPKAKRAKKSSRSARMDDEELYGYGDDEEDAKLSEIRRKQRETTDPEEYQQFLMQILMPLFRHGFSTLFYNVEKLRRYICDTDVRVKDVLACAGEQATDKLVFVQPSGSVEQTLVRVDYFFGGVDKTGLDIFPENAWAGQTFTRQNPFVLETLTPFESFLNASLQLYVRALVNINNTAANAVHQKESVEDNEVLNPSLWREKLQTALMCSKDSLKTHYELRLAATYQLSGATRLYADFVRQARDARTMLSKIQSSLALDKVTVFLSSGTLDTLLLQNEELALTSDTIDVKTSEILRRTIRKIINLMIKKTVDLPKNVDEFTIGLDNVLTEAAAEQTKRAEDIQKANQGLREQLIRSLSVAGGPGGDLREVQIGDLIERLKRLLAKTHIDSVEWTMSPQNSGVLMLSPQYTTAVDMAYEMVQEHAPNLSNSTLEDLKLRTSTKVVFAELVAHIIARTESLNPRTLQLNRFTEDTLRHGRALMTRIRRLAPIRDAGIGSIPHYQGSSVASRDGRGGFAPRNRFAVAEDREMRRIHDAVQRQIPRAKRRHGEISINTKNSAAAAAMAMRQKAKTARFF